MNKGDKVKFIIYPTGNIAAFYKFNNTPDTVYEIETIKNNDEVYLVGINNYIRREFLQVVEEAPKQGCFIRCW